MSETNEDNGGYGEAPLPHRVFEEWTDKDGNKNVDFESERALAALLIKEVVFINSKWWRKELSTKDREQIGVFVNCNDIFAWACGDAEDLPYDEMQNLYEMWLRDPNWGPAVWCMQQRKMLPQSPVAERIRNAGIWNIDSMGLRSNFYDGNCARWNVDRREHESAWENEGGAVAV